MILDYLSNFCDLLKFFILSVVLAPIVHILAAPEHLIYVVSILFVVDVVVGISSDPEGFSIKKFRNIFPKFVDASIMIIVMSALSALHELSAPLQVTGYMLVSFWLASSIVENKIKKDPNPNNPWRKIRDELRRFSQWYSEPKPPNKKGGANV